MASCARGLAVLLFALLASPAWAGGRVALVIGNGAYHSTRLAPLHNPGNDADDVAASLTRLGWQVIERKDATHRQMDEALADFGRAAANADAALIFYSGHGIQIRGRNYLMPVDADPENEAAVPYASVDVNEALSTLDDAHARLNFVVLDACRDNQLSGQYRGGASRGLARIGDTPDGTVVVYSTSPGNVANDGTGRNGVFTGALLQGLRGSDLSLTGVLGVAAAETSRQTDGKQIPYVVAPATMLANPFRFDGGVAPSPGGGFVAPAPGPVSFVTNPPVTPIPVPPPAPAPSDGGAHYLSLGNDALAAKDYGNAMQNFRLAAEQGNVDALVDVGYLYGVGLGVPQDYAQAFAWYKRGADQGNVAGAADVGLYYANGWGVTQDYGQAMAWNRKAAEQGNAGAQNEIGFLYEHGWGAAQDYGQALMWYRKAADQGDAPAQTNVCLYYANGWGVTKDYAQALVWCRKAADQNNAAAQNEIGFMYDRGFGVTQDYGTAMQWYRKAAEQGDATAERNAAVFYERGLGGPADMAQARYWYQKAAAQGEDYAKNWLSQHPQ